MIANIDVSPPPEPVAPIERHLEKGEFGGVFDGQRLWIGRAAPSKIPVLLAAARGTKPAPQNVNPAQLQAYKTIGVDISQVDEQRQLTVTEAGAFNTMYALLVPGKLTGKDKRFDRGDIAAIVSALPWYSQRFARSSLNANKDLLAGVADNSVRKLTVSELSSFKAATEVIESYAKRIGFVPKGRRYVPNTRRGLKDFMKALLLKQEIPKYVASRVVAQTAKQ